MVAGLDVVFYPSISYFKHGVGRLDSKMTFDTPVKRIGGYFCDYESGKCAADKSQPTPIPGEQDRRHFQWMIERPSNKRVYFVLFDRSVPSEGRI